MNVEKIEALLEADKPSEVIKKFKNYKGRDAKTLFLLGEAQRMIGQFDTAIKTYTKADKANPEAELKIQILLSLAACERTLGNAEEAYKTAAAVHILAEGMEFEDERISALLEMGMSLRAWGKLEESLECLNEVLAHYISERDYSAVSYVLWAKGGIFRLQGKFKEGIKSYKDAVSQAKKAKDKINEAYAYCGLAGISRIAGDVKGCVNYYKMADKIFARTEDTFGKAYTNCGMANGLRQMGDYKTALKRYVKADELYSLIGDRVDLGFVKWGRADVLKRFGKLDEALVDLKAAEKLFEGSDEKRGQILTQLSLAQVLYAMGHADTAKEKYFAAVERAKEENLNTYLEIYT
ncbi:tetratricopeptide (TPR) repeat protein [Elusimicrobium simillimum]|uniref:tetratricopeptide repeat protein n=1 Tax=Elusimicrobium simillimum TaxID=3143438 RepID=UPI003C6F236A